MRRYSFCALASLCLTTLLFHPVVGLAANAQDGWDAFHKQHYTTAEKIWRPLAKQGNGKAALGLAILREHGLGLQKDTEKSLRWYRIAADQGVSEAQHDLGIKYFTGTGVTKNIHKAYELWKAAAESGLGAAQSKLAFLYNQGIGVEKDHDMAIKWYRQAANQGNEEAMYNLSFIYQKGAGVRQDRHLSQHWLRRSAKLNHARAQFDLGLMLLHGQNIDKNVNEGKTWLMRSADNGLAEAQHYLGTLYLNGHILPPDKGKAIELLRLAAEQNHKEAKQALLDVQQHQYTATNTASDRQAPGQPVTPLAAKPVYPAAMASNKRPLIRLGTDKPSVPEAPRQPTTGHDKKTASPPPAKTIADQTSWLKRQNPGHYIIQLIAGGNLAAIKQYQSRLKKNNIKTYTYRFTHDNQQWYAAATGIFTNHDAARQHARKIQKNPGINRPFVRNIGRLQKLMENQK